MSTKIWPLRLATVIFIASVCLAAGVGNTASQNIDQDASSDGISQTGSNSADVGGWDNTVNQGVDQSAFNNGISQTGSNSANVTQGNVQFSVIPNTAQPTYIPQPSSGSTSVNLPQGEVQFSMIPNVNSFQPTYGLEMRVMNNDRWTAGPASVCYGSSISAIIKNDQDQYLRTYEKYPDGHIDLVNWGYCLGGTYVHGVFVGDVYGWHQLRARGSRSGWSSIIWIYVASCNGGNPSNGGSW